MDFLEPRTLLAAVMWDGGGGDYQWNNPSNWDTDTLPGAADDVTIGAGFLEIVHSSSATTVQSLISSSPVTLSGGTLTVAATVDCSNGFELSGGTLEYATVLSTTTVTVTANSTLSNVVMNADLDLTAFDELYLNILNGLTLNGTAHVGRGDGSQWAHLRFEGSQTIDGTGTIVLGGLFANALMINTPASIVTFASDLTVRGAGGFLYPQFSDSSFVNQGTIAADAGGQIYVGGWPGYVNNNAGSLVNEGTLTASNNGTLSVNADNWSNTGTITSTSGGTMTFINAGTSSGSISANGGTVRLDGSWTSTGPITSTSGGTIYLNNGTSSGPITATGSTVEFGGTWSHSAPITLADSDFNLRGSGTLTSPVTTDAASAVEFYGSVSSVTITGDARMGISGGTLHDGTLTLDAGQTLHVDANSTLSNVVMNADLDLTAFDALYLNILNGLTLNGTAYVGRTDGSQWAHLRFEGSQTIDGTGTIVLSGLFANALMINTPASIVTFASDLTVRGAGGFLYPQFSDSSFVNQGTIAADAGGQIYVGGWPGYVNNNAGSLVNEGTLTASNNGTLSVNADNWSNTGTITSTSGGTVTLINAGTSSGSISANAGTVRLDGNWTSSGPITATSGGLLSINGSRTISDSVSAISGGVVDINGTWANSSPLIATSDGVINFNGVWSNSSVPTLAGGVLNLRGSGMWTATSLNAGSTSIVNIEGVVTTNGADFDVTGGVVHLAGGSLVDGKMTMHAPGQLQFSGGTLDDFNITSSGITTWTSGNVHLLNVSSFTNLGTFIDQTDGVFGSVDGGCLRFVNEGYFVKTGGTGNTYLQMLLYNRGTVEIQQGQLILGCGYVGSPGNPVPPGVDPGPNPPRYEDPDPRPLPPESPPLVIPGSYTQTVTGRLIEQIAGHSGGPYGTPGTDYGQLVVNGNVVLNGSFEVEVIGGFVPGLGQQYMAINNLGTQPIAGTFVGQPEGSIIWAGNFGFSISYVGGNGNDVVLTMSQFAGVFWDGEAGDNLWENPVNWSGDTLPGPNDDVQIDLGANDFTVFVSTFGNTVRRLTSHAGLHLSSGDLIVHEESLLLGDVTLANALFGGTGDITVMGDFNLVGGTVLGSGKTLDLQGDSTFISGSIYGRNVISHGEASLVSNRVNPVTLYDGTVFENLGTLTIGELGWMIRGDSSDVLLRNTGSIVKPSGTEETGLLLPIDSEGPITLVSGALNLGDHTAGTDSHYHGTVTGAPGTVLWLTGGSSVSTFHGAIDVDHVIYYSGTAFNFNGSYHSRRTDTYVNAEITGPVAGFGTLNANADLNVIPGVGSPGIQLFDALNIGRGLVDFHDTPLNVLHLRLGNGGATSEAILRAGDITVADSFEWASGTMTGPGTHLILATGSEMTFVNGNGAGGTFWELNGRTLENHGTIHLVTNPWVRTILFSGGSTLNNYGTLRSDSLYNFELRTSGTGETFNNYGTVTQAGNGGINNSLVFNNFGTVNVDTESMTFDGGGTNAGTITGASGTMIRFSGTTLMQPDSLITSDGDVEFNDTLIDQIAGHSGAGDFGAPASDYGQLAINGHVALNATLTVQVIVGFVPSLGQQYMAINNLGTQPIAGTFVGQPEGSIIWAGNYGFFVSYVGGDGNDFVLTMSQFANSPPTADAGGPYSVAEGGSVTLSAAGSSDAQQPSTSLAYAWDLDGDGIFGEIGADAGRGDENVMEPVFSAAELNGPSTYNVQLRVTDEYGESDSASVSISILNVAPSITLTGAISASEGQSKSYSFTTIDPGADTFSLVAISGGVVGTVSNIVFDSVTGTGTFDVTFPDGASVSTVSLQLQDSDGAFSNVAALNVSVANVAPTVTALTSTHGDLAHVSTNGNLTINGSFFDPAQNFDTHTVLINWGDGTATETLPATAVNQVLDTFLKTHHYSTGGVFTITVTVLDEDGGVSAQSTSTAVVAGVGLINGTLYIIGTEGRDHIVLEYKQNHSQLKVDIKLNQGDSDCDSDDDDDNDDADDEHSDDGDRIRKTFQVSSVNRIVACLLGGDDDYNGDLDSDSSCGADPAISQIVFGGVGDDQIKGGSGTDVLIGGSGDDDVKGRDGRDILIGGTGKDSLKGGDGNDLLIGDSAANENYLAALDQALADWVTGNVTAALFDLGAITDDNKKDELFGEQGNDYLVGGGGDKLKQ